MFRKVGNVGDLFVGEKASVVVEGRRVLLVQLEERLLAYDDRCAHRGAALSEGRLEGSVLTCSAHEWRYDARTGCGINPAGIKLRRFALKIEGSDVLVDVEAREPDAGGEAP
jgi:toluene monooxygenase system ferredoxin subunit